MFGRREGNIQVFTEEGVAYKVFAKPLGAGGEKDEQERGASREYGDCLETYGCELRPRGEA